MRVSDYFLLTKARLLGNKTATIYSVMVVAFAAVLMSVINSVCSTLINQAFNEMRSMSAWFVFYINVETNSLYKLATIMFAIGAVLGSIVILAHFYKITAARKSEQRNKLILGASYTNIIIEAVIENVIVLLLGLILGGVITYLANLLLSVILEVTIIFNIYTYLVMAAVYFGITLFSTIVPSVWVNVEKA